MNISLVYASVPSISISAVAYGIKELKTIEFDFGFVDECLKDTWCNQSFTFFPTDAVSSISSVLVRLVVEQPNNNEYYIRVNDELCIVNNISNIVGKSQYVADFKCANIINGQGNYTVSLWSDNQPVYNVHYRVYITYINNPLTCEIGSTNTFDINETIILTTFIRNNTFANMSIYDADSIEVYNEYWNTTGDTPDIKNWTTDIKGQYYVKLACTDLTGNNFENYGFTHLHIYPQSFETIYNSTEGIILKLLQHQRIFDELETNYQNDNLCVSNTTLMHNITYEYCIGNKCETLKDIMYEECNYGCDYVTNECSPNPFYKAILYFVIFIIFVIILIYVVKKL